MHKFLIIFFIFIFFQNSDAQTANRCFNLFVKSETGSVEYFAEFIDSLNQRSNQILFKNKMSEHVNSDLANLAFSDRMTASYRAFKIRRILKELKNSEHMDTYDFENLALKLERLTFLIDPTVMLLMNSSEQKIYKQAQHSILAKGLENFLFDINSQTTKSMKRKIFEIVMTPFKDVYLRWTYAVFNMPKLNGAVIPIELAMKIAWSGVDNNRTELEPYLKNTVFKHQFNQFSKVYNWMLVTAIFAGLPTFVYYKYHVAVEKSQAHFVTAMAPVIEQVDVISSVNYSSQNRLDLFIAEYKEKKHQDPTIAQIEAVKKMIADSNM